ncbi:MAG: HlyD family efflux transporter periplasmic adaptor subunit [Cyanobacteria bacterium P01_C01_bin.118]
MLSPDNPVESSNPESLRAVNSDEFLPPIGQWTTVGGLVMLTGFVGAVLLSAILQYRVVVKAQATVRPSGELRLVEARTEGTITDINVDINQSVEAGDVLAVIDDTPLQTQKQQHLTALDSLTEQLAQIQAQLTAAKQQISAETEQLQQSVAVAEADLQLRQRTYQNSITTTQADLEEAEAALTLAQDELLRFRQLAGTGAVSDLRIQEKVASVTVANARLEKVKAALNPSDADVTMAQERVVQAQAAGQSTLARLIQDREELQRQYQQLERQLTHEQQELKKLEQELGKTQIRTPIAGNILSLKLRNIDQVVRPGQEVAQIAPASAQLVVQAQVPPQDIDKIAVGQSVQMRVSACPYPDFGTLAGTVDAVSPDIVVDPNNAAALGNNSQSNYIVSIQADQTQLQFGEQICRLQPGMNGQADIISRQESVLRFVLRKARILVNR